MTICALHSAEPFRLGNHAQKIMKIDTKILDMYIFDPVKSKLHLMYQIHKKMDLKL